MNTKRTAAVILAVMLLLLAVPSAGALSTQVANVGVITREERLPLGDAATLVMTTLQHQSNGMQEERYVELGAGSNLRVMTVFGNTLYGGLLDINTLHSRLVSKGLEAVAAVNGDYYTLNTGVPVGGMITDGVVRATDNYQRLVCFPTSGGAFIASAPMYTSLTVNLGDTSKSISIDQVNHSPTADRFVLLTPDYGASTQTSLAGTHVVLQVNGQLKVNATVTGTVTQIVKGSAPCAIQSGQMVLFVANTGPVDRIADLTAGTSFSIRVSCSDTRLNQCPFAIGGNERILTGGQVVSNLAAGTAPRTAVGIKADGSCVLYTVDGRQSGYSEGLSLTSLARRLQSLGCVDAVNLDGGGSTILSARYPGQNTLSVTGRPSDGAPRRVANYIVLVNDTPKLGAPARLFVYPFGVVVLKGAAVSFRAYATDQNYHPVSLPQISWWTDNLSVGSVSNSGSFTASAVGQCQVAVTGAGTTGGVALRVVDKLDSMQLVNSQTSQAITSLSVAPGARVELSVRAFLDNQSVVNQNTCFTWKVEGQIGTVSNTGVFTATGTNGVSGVITVEYAGKRASLSVTVGQRPTAIETFESDLGRFGPSASAIAFSFERDSSQAKFGLRSGRISYDFGQSQNGAVSLPANVSLPSGSSWLSVWVSGNGSGHKLSLDVVGSGGAVTTVPVCTLDFTGYRQFHLGLPAAASRVSALRLNSSGVNAAKGSFLIDHWVASATRYDSTSPPKVGFDSVSLSQDTKSLTVAAHAFNAAGLSLTASDIILKLDGTTRSFNHNQVTGQLSFTLAGLSSGMHHLTLEATDPSGARARVSYDIGTDGASPPFADVANSYWASRYITYLFRQGILTYPADGSRRFNPTRTLTRADMAVFVARVLKLDLPSYNGETMPFTDAEKIPADARAAVRALYAEGVVAGKPGKSGVYFDPLAPMSRAEFCTLLSKIIPRGYASATLKFSDSNTIPAYARQHIQTMLALGFISGFPDNTMRPFANITRGEAARLLYEFY